eukprot:CAMPEP_0179281714 /NCGR_PEP_ID=MMETSP0797-20121207/37298_1 /TAXON_ID=47934 /ORGANISM="Dinophysis acuminata, Strain DAEP01" /LENGTH=278 /DNA_ID=CAMNT_0020990435 /DNA_START=21 /DNA_END=856 /DNA_ORIENTATION=+
MSSVAKAQSPWPEAQHGAGGAAREQPGGGAGEAAGGGEGGASAKQAPVPLSKANWIAKASRPLLPRPVAGAKQPEEAKQPPAEAPAKQAAQPTEPEGDKSLEARAVGIVKNELDMSGGRAAMSSLSVRLKWGQNELKDLGNFRKFLLNYPDIFELKGNMVQIAVPNVEYHSEGESGLDESGPNDAMQRVGGHSENESWPPQRDAVGGGAADQLRRVWLDCVDHSIPGAVAVPRGSTPRGGAVGIWQLLTEDWEAYDDLLFWTSLDRAHHPTTDSSCGE